MDPDRWKQIETLFHAALERDRRERFRFLDAACGDDTTMRAEVESLLEQHSVEDYLDGPPTVKPGTNLGHYRILSPLGKGGMGEVWRARDTKLGREVAIKTLPPEFAEDADRLARFEREAKLLASLNHPNISVIHGFEEDNGTHFLVLELVEGNTLADRLKSGAIPVEESLKLALQIAEALEAAHDNGVIHRDLKPSNIKVTPDGKVKVLDFGLAKAFTTDESDALANVPTLSALATKPGTIFGTAAYMSPEQARGETANRRADIWAFGCVFFEMLTGRKAFARPTLNETLARVLESDPDLAALPALSPLIRRLIVRCLEKDSRDRLQHIGDARIDVRDALAGSALEVAGRTPGTGTGSARLKFMWAGIGTIVCVAAFVGWLVTTRSGPDTPLQVVRLDVTPIAPLRSNTLTRLTAISPDGAHIAYSTNSSLVIRSLERSDTVSLDAGGSPFFSADSQWVAFFSGVSGDLERVPVAGGSPSLVTPGSVRQLGGSWGADDTIVFANNVGLFRVPAEGGEPELLVRPAPERGELFYAWPEILPGDRAALFTIVPEEPAAGFDIAVIDLETLEIRILLRGGSAAHYASTGHLIYADEGRLQAVPFDSGSLEVAGAPTTLGVEALASARDGGAQFDISATGTLVYVPPEPEGTSSFVWVDREGREEEVGAPARPYIYPRISPDGTRVAVDVGDRNRDIYIWDFERENMTRLTDHPTEDLFAVWSRDSQRIFFRLTGTAFSTHFRGLLMARLQRNSSLKVPGSKC